MKTYKLLASSILISLSLISCSDNDSDKLELDVNVKSEPKVTEEEMNQAMQEELSVFGEMTRMKEERTAELNASAEAKDKEAK